MELDTGCSPMMIKDGGDDDEAPVSHAYAEDYDDYGGHHRHPSAYRSEYGPARTAHSVISHLSLLNSSSFRSGPPRPAGRRAVQSR